MQTHTKIINAHYYRISKKLANLIKQWSKRTVIKFIKAKNRCKTCSKTQVAHAATGLPINTAAVLLAPQALPRT